MTKILTNANILKAMKKSKVFKPANIVFNCCRNPDKQLCKDMDLTCTWECFHLYNPNDTRFYETNRLE